MTPGTTTRPPRILLIGLGRFGQNHFRVLKALEANGELELVGVVVKDKGKHAADAPRLGAEIFSELTPELLRSVDAVDIVTPANAHRALATLCLPYVHVLIEKPLAESETDARELTELARQSGHHIMVGHIFRYHPVTLKLRAMLGEPTLKLERVAGQFTGPAETDQGLDPSLEIMHYYDILDFLFDGDQPSIVATEAYGRVYKTSLRYPRADAVFTLGWTGDEKVRRLDFYADKAIIKANFAAGTIDVYRDSEVEHIVCESQDDPLTRELRAFVGLIRGERPSRTHPGGEIAARVVGVAARARPIPQVFARPRVAIIGAGIFGVSAALELASFADVAIFERNKDILSEASFVNQYRHHWGYHYPRSSETVLDIAEAISDFEALYQDAIVRNFPTYYGVAKEGSKVSAEEYLKFCDAHHLPYTLEFPSDECLNKDIVEICLKTLEPIYDYYKLKSLSASYIAENHHIALELNTRVTDAKLTPEGKKILRVDRNGETREEVFDYVINVTYANFNQFAHWLGFPKKPIRLDVVEALIVEIPIPRISLAVMDGPFTNLVPTGQDHLFTLVHIKESILKRFVPSDGLVPPGLEMNSNAKTIIEKSQEWFPILAKAELLESRYIYRSVNAYREHDDARPSDIVEYGFGCWSILGGKILNCVTIARELAREIGRRNPKINSL